MTVAIFSAQSYEWMFLVFEVESHGFALYRCTNRTVSAYIERTLHAEILYLCIFCVFVTAALIYFY